MLSFEEELKKFQPSLEIEDVQDAIYSQDLVDMSDVMVKMVKDGLDPTKYYKANMTIPKL